VAIHSGDFKGCTISVKTEEFRHELFGLRYRVVAVTVTRAGKDLGYPAPAVEGRDESEVVEKAASAARVFITNRLSP
jgi:hypothetical protein